MNAKGLKRWIPALSLLILMAMAWYYNLPALLSSVAIEEKRMELMRYVQLHPAIAPLTFIGIYITVTALSLPVAVYLTLLGGFLFGQPYGTIYAVVSATVGASILYLAATTALLDFHKNKNATLLEKMREGFRENGVSYLLFLRLMPLFPFWFVNIAPAFFGVPFYTFFWTTALGITPGAFVFAQLGTGLASIDTSKKLSVAALLQPEVRIALIALAIFSLAPVVYKVWKKYKVKR